MYSIITKEKNNVAFILITAVCAALVWYLIYWQTSLLNHDAALTEAETNQVN